MEKKCTAIYGMAWNIGQSDKKGANDMIYRIIDVRGNDTFESVTFLEKEDAIWECKLEWQALSEHDKKLRKAFYVGAFEDGDAIDHDVVFEIDTKKRGGI